MTGNTRKAMMQHSTLIMAIALTAATRRIGDKKLSEAHDWRIWRSCIRTIKSRENVFILFRPLQVCALCGGIYVVSCWKHKVEKFIFNSNSRTGRGCVKINNRKLTWKEKKREKKNSPEKREFCRKRLILVERRDSKHFQPMSSDVTVALTVSRLATKRLQCVKS